MVKWVVGAVCVLALGGCSLLEDEPSQQAPAVQAKNSLCASHAAERANDAAINGYDGEIQRAIFKETYDSCAAIQAKMPSAKASQ